MRENQYVRKQGAIFKLVTLYQLKNIKTVLKQRVLFEKSFKKLASLSESSSMGLLSNALSGNFVLFHLAAVRKICSASFTRPLVSSHLGDSGKSLQTTTDIEFKRSK